MLREFRLPDVGEGLTEAEIVTWRVAPGDEVTVNQPLVDIETAKAVVELPSPYAGTVSGLLVTEGSVVPVGTPIIAVLTADTSASSAATAAIANAGGSAGASAAPPAATAATAEGSDTAGAAGGNGREAVLVGYGVRASDATPRRRPRTRTVADPWTGQPGTLPAGPAGDPHGTVVPEAGPPGEAVKPIRHGGLEVGRHIEEVLTHAAAPVRAKPPVRRLARELGVELAAVDATGPHGDVTRADVERAARIRAEVAPGASSAPAGAPDVGSDVGRAVGSDSGLARGVAGTRPAAGTATGAGDPGQSAGSVARVTGGAPRAYARTRAESAREDQRIPVRGVLRSMADAMVRSAFTAPHVTEWVDVDVSATMALLPRLRDRVDAKVTPMTMVAAGLLHAVQRYPRINASWDEAAGEVVVHGAVHLGIAADTPRGLLVPVVHDADLLALPGLAAALADLVQTARAGTLTPQQTTGGTITITNVGVFGVDGGTPILPPGQAAILAMGRVLDRPWVVDGQVVARPVMQLSLSFDHRMVDGALGSRVLGAVADFLTDPALALLG